MLLLSSVVVGGLALVASPAAAAGDVTVNVEQTDGGPIDGADVSLRFASNDSEVANGSTSSGSVTFSSVNDGTYYAVVEADGYVDSVSSNITVSGSSASATVTLSESSEVHNETVALSDGTLTAYGSVETVESINSPLNRTSYEWSFTGVNETENGTETTVLRESSRYVDENSTATEDVSLSDSDLEEFDKVRVVISGDSEATNSTDSGTTAKIGGGGGGSGGLPGGTVMGIPVVAIALGLLGATYIFWREQ